MAKTPKTEATEQTTPTNDSAVRALANPMIERLASEPLLADPDRAKVFFANVTQVAQLPDFARMTQMASAESDSDFWDPESWTSAYRPYVVKDGVLQIPIFGTLLNRFPYQAGNWATGYKYVEMALQRGLADGNVKGIALICNSPGGEVAGNFELADLIYEARGQKPIRAFAADSAYSAAYSLASSAESIAVTRSGGVGSIGVIMVHMSYEGMLKDWGVEVTQIFAGKHKADGWPYKNLSEQARTRYQARVDKLYGVFTQTVARNRNMSDNAVRDTEALTYDASEALEMKLADTIGTLEEGLLLFSTDLANTGVEHMTDKTQTPVATGKTDAEVEQLVSAADAAGFARAQSRYAEIMALPEAAGREETARMFASKGDEPVARVKEILATLPKAAPAATTPAKGKDHFAEAMDASPTPAVPSAESPSTDTDSMAVVLGHLGLPVAK